MDGQNPTPVKRKRRVDHLLIAEMVARKARVLDVGCGDGDLLELLTETRDVDGRGVEISREGVNHCVARGLSVIQGDADTDLATYPDGAFDYAILSLTIQATRNPRAVTEQLLRIARHAIISLPNFGHWAIRLKMLWDGRMPVTGSLPYAWYDSPNIHLCSISDFVSLCGLINARIERSVALDGQGQRIGLGVPTVMQNLIGSQAVFLLTRDAGRR
jgi:methionine biosynthesis protein MetW